MPTTKPAKKKEQRKELKRLNFTKQMQDQVFILMRMGRTFEQAKEEVLIEQ